MLNNLNFISYKIISRNHKYVTYLKYNKINNLICIALLLVLNFTFKFVIHVCTSIYVFMPYLLLLLFLLIFYFFKKKINVDPFLFLSKE